MPILDAMGDGIEPFRPRTYRQFIVLNISRRFHDLPHLQRYLPLCAEHTSAQLLAAARDAATQGENKVEHFFNQLRQSEGREVPS